MGDCKCSCGCASNTSRKSVYPCAGASNVGKISMDLAIKLHQLEKYKMSCTAGVGGDICSFVDSAKGDDNINLLIDGCPVACLKKMFDNKGIENYDHIVLTEMGIKKEGVFEYDPSHIDRLVNDIKEMGL